MTFEEFLIYVRRHIGNYCTDEYWKNTYDQLPKKTRKFILSELPYLAVNAIGTDSVSKKG